MRCIARLGALVSVSGFLATGLAAQTAAPPASAVVSIRPSGTVRQVGCLTGPPPVDQDSAGTCPTAANRFDWADVTLALLVSDAYDLLEFQVVGGPDWVHTRRWDVSATAAALNPDQARQLVRRLVDERFALKSHTETRDLPVYNLVLARADATLGPKITRAMVDCTPFLTGQRPMQESPPDPDNRFGLCSVGGAFTPNGLLTPRLNGRPLTGLVQHLEEVLGQRVIDRTGLTGNFDIELSYLDETLVDRSAPPPPSRGPSLFVALQEQLGLKLEPARGPVEVLVVDSAREPTTN